MKPLSQRKRPAVKELDSTIQNSIKGRIAEALIEELFIKLKYDVHQFGIEHSAPAFADRTKPKQGVIAEMVRSMPDFIVTHQDTDDTQLLEVKFRKDIKSKPAITRLQELFGKDYLFDDAILIVVTPGLIMSNIIRDFRRTGDLDYLNNQREIEGDRKIIMQFIRYSKRIFEGLV